MPFDGLVTKSVISELKPILIDGKVNKITQPTKWKIVVSLMLKTDLIVITKENHVTKTHPNWIILFILSSIYKTNR